MRSTYFIPNSFYSYQEKTSHIEENDTGYFIQLDMPGVKKEDLKVSLENSNLYIEGARANRGPIKRAFSLPEDVEVERIQAQLKDGVLELALPKKEKARPKLITVNEGAESLLPKSESSNSCCE